MDVSCDLLSHRCFDVASTSGSDSCLNGMIGFSCLVVLVCLLFFVKDESLSSSMDHDLSDCVIISLFARAVQSIS